MAAALGIIGTGISLVGSFASSAAQNRMIQQQTIASTKAENSREQQMQLEAQRARRQTIREGLMARSMNLTAGVAQGAQFGSGVAAGLSNATAQSAQNQQGINSGEILGSRVFQANRDYFQATSRGQGAMSFWQGISSIGGAITNSAPAIARLGGSAPGSPNYSPWGNQ